MSIRLTKTWGEPTLRPYAGHFLARSETEPNEGRRLVTDNAGEFWQNLPGSLLSYEIAGIIR